MTTQLAIQRDVAQYLTFVVGGAQLGIDLLDARVIIQHSSVTVVPEMPAALRGVINLRGRIVPLVELGPLLGCSAQPPTSRACVVVVEVTLLPARRVLVGLVVDAVRSVLELSFSEIQAVPMFGTQVQPNLLHGIGASATGFVELLDVSRVLQGLDESALTRVVP